MPKITNVERFWLDVPLVPVAQRNMERSLHGWRISEICRVTTDTDLVGIGETLPNYTWGKVPEDARDRVIGRNPLDVMWDDSLGAGLQMALFDVAGKIAGVPVRCFFGKQHREWCPIAWWTIDMPPEDCASQARDAVAAGYRALKQKGRPWFDVFEQVKQTCAAIDADVKIDLDFNEHLNHAGAAVPVLRELDAFANLAIYEEPIPKADAEGNRRVRRHAVRDRQHWTGSDPLADLRGETHDGYVVFGGALLCSKAAHLCQIANKPFWLQLVGTGVTTAFSLHMGAAFSHAQWPAVSCLNIYADQLLVEPIRVVGGFAQAPQKPGLGVELSEKAFQYCVDSPVKPNVKALYAWVRPSGQRIWFLDEWSPVGYWSQNWAGNLPPCEHGVKFERWDDDGSTEWQKLAERVRAAPIWD